MTDEPSETADLLRRAATGDGAALADLFARYRKRLRQMGASDLKIAAIARAKDTLLLSANLHDFNQVPGLRVENWLT